MRIRALIIFLTVNFGFSWLLWLLMILSQRGALPFNFPLNPLGSFGPAIGAIVAVRFTEGPAGMRKLLRRLVQGGLRIRWYLFAVFGFLGVYAAAILAFSAITRTVPHVQNLHLWYMILPVAVVVLVLGGPLGEEIGWRGYLLPAFQLRFPALTASLLVGFIWALWHVPLFFLKGTPQHQMSLAAFTLFVLAASILYTWLQNSTGGSLLGPLVFHTSMNTLSICVGTALPEFDASKLGNYLFLGISLLLALWAVAITRGTLCSRSETAMI